MGKAPRVVRVQLSTTGERRHRQIGPHTLHSLGHFRRLTPRGVAEGYPGPLGLPTLGKGARSALEAALP